MDGGSMVAKVTGLLGDAGSDGTAAESSTSPTPDSASRFPHNGANEASLATMEVVAKSPQQALVLVGTLLSLSLLIVLLFIIISDRFMKRSRWNRSKTTALWRRRGVAGVSDEGATAQLPQKDIVKLGWVPVEDFDHWSNVLIQNDTEHERLLLAVSPHH